MRNAIRISNPLGEDYSLMRTSMLNGILTSLGTNFARRNKNVKLFDLGKIYIAKQLPLTDYADERPQFTLGFYGDGDFFDLKGVLEDFLAFVGIKTKMECRRSSLSFYHPGRQADVLVDGRVLGFMGEIHPDVAAAYGMNDRVYVAQIDLKNVLELASFLKASQSSRP